MAPKCGVCVDSESKYKCPVCLTPYCSLPCYRTHKETPCSKSGASVQVGEEKAPGQPPRSFEEDEDESGWRLRRSQLKALGTSSFLVLSPGHSEPSSSLIRDGLAENFAASDDIRRMLRDDELRKLILKVDSSITPEKELEKVMEGPACKEFTDKILAMINSDEHSHLTQS